MLSTLLIINIDLLKRCWPKTAQESNLEVQNKSFLIETIKCLWKVSLYCPNDFLCHWTFSTSPKLLTLLTVLHYQKLNCQRMEIFEKIIMHQIFWTILAITKLLITKFWQAHSFPVFSLFYTMVWRQSVLQMIRWLHCWY